ncbi:hypothetical protein I350_04441 [Cryptococcus amylolentus CBS 6273]|nr:hypothetical protein I350_04441 [Cryptococcus amylolentus CBS 6273]
MSQFTEQIWTVIDGEENSFACDPQSERRARPVALTRNNLRSLGISGLEANTNTVLLSAFEFDPAAKTLSRTVLTAVRGEKRIPMTEYQVSMDAVNQVDGLISLKLEELEGQGDGWLASCFQEENAEALQEKEGALFSELDVGGGRVQLVRVESTDAVKQLWEEALEFEQRASIYDEESD